MSIIITEEDLCKKHAKKCAKICQFSSLPSKCFQVANDPNTKIDSKPHICAYNYNTRTGFRAHKKIWGPRVLSSTLVYMHYAVLYNVHMGADLTSLLPMPAIMITTNAPCLWEIIAMMAHSCCHTFPGTTCLYLPVQGLCSTVSLIKNKKNRGCVIYI